MKKTLPLVLSLSLAACAPIGEEIPSTDATENQGPLAPPEAGKGIQLRMEMTIDSGAERYGCQMFQVPKGGLFIHEEEVRFGFGGHHVLLYKTPYTTIPTRDENGEMVDTTTIHDCSQGVTARWKINSVLGGSETPGNLGMLRGLPEGVAVHVPEDTVLVMSVHYLNASRQPLNVDARMNLHTIAQKDVQTEAGLLYLDNHMLHVPAKGGSTAHLRCPVPSDVSIVNLQSHMHARGIGFSASILDKNTTKETVVYETTRWIEPPVTSYDAFLKLTAGQMIATRCTYQNGEAHDVGYGPKSGDEMCQLIGPYFPRDARFEACATAQGEFAGTWIGEGSADGSQTADCIKESSSFDGEEGGSMAACVAASCPAIAEEVSAVMRCQRAHPESECETELETLSKMSCSP